jgi:WD40 repeat protein
MWTSNGSAFVVATNDGIAFYRDGILHTLTAPSRLSQLRLTETGLVAGIDANGEPMVLRPGEHVFDHVSISSHPIGIAAFGSVIAMSFLDGSVEVVDTADQREWVIQAQPEEPWSLRLLAHNRLLTSGRSELRLWTLSNATPEIVATLPTQANNVVFDAAGDALFGGNDGAAYIVKHRDSIASAVHRHDMPYAFGVAWCGAQACSSASDGKILCTDLTNGISSVAIDVGANPPWMSAGRDHCFAAGSMGVYDVGTRSISPIYEHGHEAYRLAATADGHYVASGDWGGEIIVYDNTTRQLTAKKNIHSGLVSNVAWSGQTLVTSGVDGLVEASTPWLVPLRTWQLDSPVRYLDANGGSIGAGLDDGSLWFASLRDSGYRVSINATFSALAMSPSGKWLAAGTLDGELIVVTADRRAAAARFEHGRVSCVGFDSDSSLLVCTPSGRVMRVPLDGMPFQPLIRKEP